MGKNVKKIRKVDNKGKQNLSLSKISSSELGSSDFLSPINEVGKKKEREPCAHIERGVTLNKLTEKLGSSISSKCEDCRGTNGDRKAKKGKGKGGKKGGNFSNSGSKAVWVCLSCGHFSCGGIGLPNTPQSHAVRHAKQNHHPLVVHYENHQLIWCFQCSRLIHAENFQDNENKDLLNEAVMILKDGHAEKSSVDVEDIWFGRGTNDVKSDSSKMGADGKFAYHPRGLVNLGNTCFFNSVLQNLLALSKLRDYFVVLEESGGSITSSLRKLFLETKDASGSRGAIDPKSLLSSFCSKAPQFKGYQQHDSHELLRCLLERLSNEELGSKNVIKSSHGSLIDSSFVDTFFGGKLSSTVTCLSCGHASTIHEPFLDLSLSVPTKKNPSKRTLLVTQGNKQKLPPKRSGRNPSKSNRLVGTLQGEKYAYKPTVGNYDPEVQPSLQTEEQLTVPLGDCALSDSIFSENIALDMGLSIDDLSAINDPNNNQAVTSVGNPTFDDFSWLDYVATNEAPKVNDPNDPFGSLTMLEHPETIGVTPENCDDVEGGNISVCEFAMKESVPPTPNDLSLSLSLCHITEKTTGDSPSLTAMHQSQANLLPCGNLTTENGFCPLEETRNLILESNSGDSFTEDVSQLDANVGHSTESYGEVLNFSARAIEHSPEVQDSALIKDLTSSVEVIRTETEVSSAVLGDNQDFLDFSGFEDLFNEPEVSLESKPPIHPASDAMKISKSEINGDSSESDPNEVDNDDVPVSIESCIAYFMKSELLSKDEHAWECDNCSKVLQEKIQSRKNMQRGRLDLPKVTSVQTSINDIDDQEAVDSSVVNALSLDVDVCETRSVLTGNCLEADSDMTNFRTESQKIHLTNGSHSPVDSSSFTTQMRSLTHEDCESDEDGLSRNRIHSSKSESGVCNEEVGMENMKVKRDATKTILINKAPSILTIHLKRFSQDVRGRLSKLNGHVSFTENINLGPYIEPRCETDAVKYRLVGVVEHSGTMRFGHYIAYVRGTKSNGECVWYYASDSHIRETCFEEVLRCEAYILFYEAI